MSKIIIKLINGIWIPVALVFGTNILLWSCKKDPKIAEQYTITVKNKYFEDLNNLKLGDFIIDTLHVNDSKSIQNVAPGAYFLNCTTVSQLSILASITLNGSNEDVDLTLNQNGEWILE